MSNPGRCDITLFTDFGTTGPYVGQLHAVIRAAGFQPVDLFHDAPAFDVRAAAILLPALLRHIPPPQNLLAVVDPGVGGTRDLLLVESGRMRIVAPDNGLLIHLIGTLAEPRCYRVHWHPEYCSSTFHGRDLLLPILIRRVLDEPLGITACEPQELCGWGAPESLQAVIYQDRYGNCMTGIDAARMHPGQVLQVGQYHLQRAETFSDRPPGTPFWFVNSFDLVEIAVNQGSAAQLLSLSAGSPVTIV